MKTVELSHEKLAELCRGFSLLLQAGISLADSAFLLSREETGTVQQTMKMLGVYLDEGSALSSAMEKTGAFPGYVPGLVRVGEETGRLQEALEALAEYYEEQTRMVARLKRTLGWPCLLLAVLLVVLAVLIVKVLPVFDGVYASLGGRLTGVAAGLLGLGQMLQRALPVLAAFLTAFAVLAGIMTLHEGLRKRLMRRFFSRFGDRWLLRSIHNARYAGAMAMSFSSGLPLERAMELSRALLADIPGAAERADACAAALETGADLSQAMEQARLLPPWACQLLTAGLRGGNADRVMEHIARRMTEDAGQQLEDWAARVEPALVLAASALVGAVLLGAMLPLVDILSALG